MNEISKNENSKTLCFFALIILAPVLAVQFPRIIAYIPAVTGLVLVAYMMVRHKGAFTFSKNIAISFGAILALCTASILWAQAPEDATERVIKLAALLPFFGLFLMAMPALGPQININKLNRYILWSCAAAATMITAEIVMDAPLYRALRDLSIEDKFSTAVYNRASLVVVFMGVTAALFIKDKTIKAFLPLIPIVAMLFFIQSQAAQLSIVIGAIFYMLFPVRQKWAWYALGGLIAVGVAAKPFIVTPIYDLMAADLENMPVMKDAYIAQRLEIWSYISEKIFESPLWGHGIEFTKTYKEFNSAGVFGSSSSVLHPHSFILQIWIEFGALGVAVFTGLCAVIMRGIYQAQNPKFQKVALTVFIMMLFAASASYGLWQGWWLGLMVTTAGLIAINTRTTLDSV